MTALAQYTARAEDTEMFCGNRNQSPLSMMLARQFDEKQAELEVAERREKRLIESRKEAAAALQRAKETYHRIDALLSDAEDDAQALTTEVEGLDEQYRAEKQRLREVRETIEGVTA